MLFRSPKGRRNYKEKDLECALREFEEETGISSLRLNVVENVLPFEETFIGTNHKSYKHKYFLAYLNDNKNYDKLMEYALLDNSCVAFNTSGYMKSKIDNLQNNKNIETILESDGFETINTYIDVDFGSELNITENPQHLMYFVGCFYDLSDLTRDLQVSQYQNLIPFSLKTENVISDGSLISKSQIYLMSDGNIWPGEVHFLNGKYRSGIIETTNSVDLDRVEIENIKIQDYRQLKNILKHNILD